MNLLEGVIKFHDEYFETHKKLFSSLAKSQTPHTLYIGCSDSRVVPNIITHTLPGELFVIRNIANIVPPFSKNDGTFKCTASVLEYAINVLKVKNILVCGHSNCGGCKAFYEDLSNFPNVKQWISISNNIKERVLKKNLDPINRAIQTEQLNIVQQLQNLLTYPFIKEKFLNKEIELHGWYYVIETGDVFDYNFDKKQFELIK